MNLPSPIHRNIEFTLYRFNMPLFQEAIIKKHLSAIDETLIESAYSEYQRV